MAQGRSTKIISMIKWIRTSRLSIKNSLSAGTVCEHFEFSHEFSAVFSTCNALLSLSLWVKMCRAIPVFVIRFSSCRGVEMLTLIGTTILKTNRFSHTVEYDPFTKSQLASMQLTLGPHMVKMWSDNPQNCEGTKASKTTVCGGRDLITDVQGIFQATISNSI